MNKTIVITGGSDGLGKTLATTLSNNNNVMIPEVGIKNINN